MARVAAAPLTDSACAAAGAGWMLNKGSGWWDGNYQNTLYNHYLTPNATRPDCIVYHNPGWKAARSYHRGGVNLSVRRRARRLRQGLRLGGRLAGHLHAGRGRGRAVGRLLKNNQSGFPLGGSCQRSSPTTHKMTGHRSPRRVGIAHRSSWYETTSVGGAHPTRAGHFRVVGLVGPAVPAGLKLGRPYDRPHATLNRKWL